MLTDSRLLFRSWNKRKTNSWKSIFQRGERRSNNSIKSKFISNPIAKETSAKSEIKETRAELPVIVSAGNSNNSSFKEKTKLTKSEFCKIFLMKRENLILNFFRR